MAMGVAPEKVYDFLSTEDGIKKAIDKIRELKPYFGFWKSGAMQAQLMKDQVDMITGWNGRFDNAKDGAIVGYTFNQALRDYDGFGSQRCAK